MVDKDALLSYESAVGANAVATGRLNVLGKAANHPQKRSDGLADVKPRWVGRILESDTCSQNKHIPRVWPCGQMSDSRIRPTELAYLLCHFIMHFTILSDGLIPDKTQSAAYRDLE